MNAKKRNSGLTLIELLVAIGVFAILTALALPGYRQWIANARVRTTSESIQNGLRFARNQAVDMAVSVRFELVPTSNTGWIVCVPANIAGSCATLSVACSATTRTSCVLERYVGQANVGSVSLGTAAGLGGTFGNRLSDLTLVGVTFDAFGRPTDYNNTSLGRVDVYGASSGTRRLVNTVSSSGAVRQCDANLPLTANTPGGCS